MIYNNSFSTPNTAQMLPNAYPLNQPKSPAIQKFHKHHSLFGGTNGMTPPWKDPACLIFTYASFVLSS